MAQTRNPTTRTRRSALPLLRQAARKSPAGLPQPQPRSTRKTSSSSAAGVEGFEALGVDVRSFGKTAQPSDTPLDLGDVFLKLKGQSRVGVFRRARQEEQTLPLQDLERLRVWVGRRDPERRLGPHLLDLDARRSAVSSSLVAFPPLPPPPPRLERSS